MLPPLTDFVALAGIALVACAACLRLPGLTSVINHRSTVAGRWLAGLCFVAMWFPVGVAQLPVAAYIRGVTSDFSVSLVVLAVFSLTARLWGLRPFGRPDRQAVFYAVAATALLLYPMALGWGDWDAYRPGWGSIGMWAVLLLVCVACWAAGLRLLPVLIGLAILAWTLQLMESGNLWDYLFDPWLAGAAIFKCMAASATQLRHQFRARRVSHAVGQKA
jgi:hypothetical protein